MKIYIQAKILNYQQGVIHIVPLLIISAVVGVISFLLLTSAAPFNQGLFRTIYPKPLSKAQDNMDTAKSIDTSKLQGINAVVVRDWMKGNTAHVALVMLNKPGFVAIYDANKGKPGKVLGISSQLNAGENKDVSVSLSRETKEGEPLYAILYSSKDTPLKDDKGKMVMMKYVVGNLSEGR